jgi:hypothetical protein
MISSRKGLLSQNRVLFLNEIQMCHRGISTQIRCNKTSMNGHQSKQVFMMDMVEMLSIPIKRLVLDKSCKKRRQSENKSMEVLVVFSRIRVMRALLKMKRGSTKLNQ